MQSVIAALTSRHRRILHRNMIYILEASSDRYSDGAFSCSLHSLQVKSGETAKHTTIDKTINLQVGRMAGQQGLIGEGWRGGNYTESSIGSVS